jgi:hypothetical protein
MTHRITRHRCATSNRGRWSGTVRGSSGLTLTEALVAGVIVAVTLPALIQAWMTIARMDAAQAHRAMGTALGQLVLEQMHYRLYNGDSRGGLKLNDSIPTKKAAYGRSPPAYLSVFFGLQDTTGSPAILSASSAQFNETQSSYLTAFLNCSGAGGSFPCPITETTNPALADALASFRIQASVMPHLDHEPTDLALATKLPTQPKVDLARVQARISWKDSNQIEHERQLVTRFVRPFHEQDLLLSYTGR